MIVLAGKDTAEDGALAEGIEIVAADPVAARVMRLASGGQIELVRSPGKDGGKGLLMIANLLPKGVAKLSVSIGNSAGAPMTALGAHDGELLGIFDRKGAQADGVKQLKNGGISADAEGQGQDGDRGKAGIQAQQTRAEAQILPQGFHWTPPIVWVYRR